MKRTFYPFFTLSFLEKFILALLIIATAGYIVYLKIPRQKTVYIETNIQPADWWRSNALIPTAILENLHVGSKDKNQHLEITDLRYFFGETKGWEYYKNNSIGMIRFKISANEHNNVLFYENQELLSGNPLSVELDNTKLELLITKVQDNRITDNYKHITLTVKVYTQKEELIKHFKEGTEFKDNNGFTYAKIVDVTIENSQDSVADQWGNLLERRDPILYDLILKIDTLVQEEGTKLVGYDGRPTSMGSRFVFNHSTLRNFEGWIIDAQ
jgi:hypothetical protein